MPTLDLIETTDLLELLAADEHPCISIYMPTDHRPSGSAENRIRYKNAVKRVSQSLGIEDIQQAIHNELLHPLRLLLDDENFWASQRQGLAVFRSPQRMWVRRTLRPVPEIAVVANSFHVRPLVRIVQEADRYQVLCLSVDRVALYEGSRDQLTEVPLHPQVPQGMGEALGEPSHVTKTRRTIYDQGETDAKDAQLMRYFRRVDEAIWEHHSRRANLPLILAALPEYHGFFHDASHNPHLHHQGIRRDPFKDIDETLLGELAWQTVQPIYEQRIAEFRERFGEAQAHGKASDQLEEVARLVAQGQIASLLVREDRHVGGIIDPQTGDVTFKSIEDPAVDDLLDDMAERVIRQRGEVVVATPEQMPYGCDVAGIQRF